MSEQLEVNVKAADFDDLGRIESLMQFYNYDLSEWLPVGFGPDGLYAIDPKEEYWGNASVKPYVLRVNGELAGFAVVDDEFVRPVANYNLGYFFIARRFRGRGVSHKFLNHLFRRHAGAWQIYHYAINVPASIFWSKAIPQLIGRTPLRHEIVVDEQPTILYEFSTSAA